MSDSVVVKDHGIRVIEAPDETLITLDVIWASNGRGMYVSGNRIILGSAPWDVMYKIVGWDAETMCLRAVKMREGVIGGGE